MTWSNLYSTESKYKVTLYSSAHARIWLVGQVLMLVFVMSVSLKLILSISVIYTLALVALIIFPVIFSRGLITADTFPTKAEYFTIDLSGYCQFSADDIWLLTPASKLGFFGCYLNLEKIDPLTQKLKYPKQRQRRFIYQDQLNEQDYARLSRVILKNKSEPHSLEHTT